MGVARGTTVVLAVGASKAIHPTVSLSPSQMLQGHGETLQQFCQRAWAQESGLEPILTALLSSYNQSRFSPKPASKALSLRVLKKQLWQYVRRQTV